MHFIIVVGVLSWWILWTLITSIRFLPYNENQVPITANLSVAIILLSLGLSAFLSIPTGYLYYTTQKYLQKKRLSMQLKFIYLSWLGLFIFILSYLGIRIFT